MNAKSLLLLLSIAGLVTVSPCFGDSPSGPKVGEKIPALKVHLATGDDAGKEVDIAEVRKDGTTIFIFVDAEQFDRPIARFVRELDQQLVQRDRRDVQLVAIWLTADVAKSKEHLPRIQKSLQLGQTTWTVFPGDRSGPEGWQVDPDRAATVIVARDRQVLHAMGYDSINETVAEATLKHAMAKP